jgi:hypothetical protein
MKSRTGSPLLDAQVKRACSNIVSLLSRVDSGKWSRSELCDSNRKQKAKSSSMPSFPDFLPVLLSQTLRAALSSSVCSWQAFCNRVMAGNALLSALEQLIVACFCWMAHACVANHLVAPSMATSRCCAPWARLRFVLLVQSRCRCKRGEPSPDADVGGVSPCAPAQLGLEVCGF